MKKKENQSKTILKKLLFKPEKIISTLHKLWPIFLLFYLASIYLMWYQLKLRESKVIPYIVVGIIVSIVTIIVHAKHYVTKNTTLYGYILSFIIAVYNSYNIVAHYNLKEVMNNKLRILCFLGNIYYSFFVVSLIVAYVTKHFFINDIDELKPNIKKQFIETLIYAISISFIIYIYVPSETFFASYQDYNFPYFLIIKALLIKTLYVIFLITCLTCMLNIKYYASIRSIQIGFLFAIYLQYMFMNKSVGILDGSTFRLREHLFEVIVNSLVWIILIILPLVVCLRSKTKALKLANYGALILGIIHVLSYILLLIGADKRCFTYGETYYDFSEQFKVGSGNNIIVLIIDAADNSYIEELTNDEDPILNEYKDFTIYTNTCSVYDATNTSQLQMVTNFPFDNTSDSDSRRKLAWNTPWSKEFFKRFHEAGYKVNFFNFDYETSPYVIGNIDNAKALDIDSMGIQYINYKKIYAKNQEIIKYRLYPTILKSSVSLYNVADPEPVVIFNTPKGCYENEDFYDNANLELGDSLNYVIFNHIKGVHMPNDNAESLARCLEITDKYIDELKRLGVYDDATIIVTADHGHHEGDNLSVAEAATPIFMIKEAGQIQDKAEYNDAPICHSDIMATLLYNAGLYEGEKRDSIISSATITDGLNVMDDLILNYDIENDYDKNISDEELFGYPIEFYSSGELRERQWFDRIYDKDYPKIARYNNVLYGFIYEGTTKDLENCVESKENLYIYPLSINFE